MRGREFSHKGSKGKIGQIDLCCLLHSIYLPVHDEDDGVQPQMLLLP